jgi:hypothetical protein
MTTFCIRRSHRRNSLSWPRAGSRISEVRVRDIPDPGTGGVRPRPIVDVVVEGLDVAPQACLLDSGATAVRVGAHGAEICGIDLQGAPRTRLAVGGAVVTALMAEVTLEVDTALADGRSRSAGAARASLAHDGRSGSTTPLSDETRLTSGSRTSRPVVTGATRRRRTSCAPDTRSISRIRLDHSMRIGAPLQRLAPARADRSAEADPTTQAVARSR